MNITLTPAYGFAILDAALYGMLMLWMGFQVGKARRKFNVPLPAAYENKADSVFNRYQRAHANSVEGAPMFFLTLLVSALATPVLSSIAGFVFVVGRYRYCVGYYEGVEKRRQGGFYLFAQLYLLLATLFFAIKLIVSS